MVSILLVLYGLCVLAAIAVGAVAAWSDVRSMTISNKSSIIIIALFPVAYAALSLAGPVAAPWWSHAGAMLIVFLVTLGLFMAGAMGGGDSKLAAACALWVGLGGLVPFLVAMMVAGMVLGFVALGLRGRMVFPRARADGWIGRVQRGENAIPYGVAIIFGLVAGLHGAGAYGPLMMFFPSTPMGFLAFLK